MEGAVSFPTPIKRIDVRKMTVLIDAPGDPMHGADLRELCVSFWPSETAPDRLQLLMDAVTAREFADAINLHLGAC
jgi:hypothetical protein